MKKKIIGISVCILLIAVSVLPVAGSIDENESLNMNNDDNIKLMKQIIENEVTSDSGWVEDDKLIASDGVVNDCFGYSVSIDGDYAIIGAPGELYGYGGCGFAYVFKREGTTWIEEAKLLASDGEGGDCFGRSVSIDGDYAIIGAIFDDDSGTDSGSAYVFKREGTAWIEEAKLLASDGEGYDEFGCSVSIDGDYAIVGAHMHWNVGDIFGSAYVFKRSGTSWTEQAKLLPLDGAQGDFFGGSVSIDGDNAIIGAYGDSANGFYSGSAYVFTRAGTIWTKEQRLLASDGAAEDFFGSSVSIDGDNAIIGAPYDDDNGYDSGSAYVFTRSGTVWTQQAKLIASVGYGEDSFGFSVSIRDNYAMIGAPGDGDNGFDSGSIYVFTRDGTIWTEEQILLASDGAAYDYFGLSISIDGDYAIIGAPGDKDNGLDSGSAYIFKKNNPPNIPSNPSPEDGAIDVDIDAELNWIGGDPDAGDIVTYDVYFDIVNPPVYLASSDQTETTFDPGTMDHGETYYWQIKAEDNLYATTSGPIWSFTTEELVGPYLDCSGTLSWTDVTPGETVTGSFTVENIGAPDSLLDWEIDEYPEWGDWTFDPESGTDLEEGDTVTIDVEVVAPDEQEQTFTGEIVLVNSEDSADTCTIDVSLATPVNQQSFSFPLIQRLLERFPNMFPILRNLMELYGI